jgi:hypothetical protein
MAVSQDSAIRRRLRIVIDSVYGAKEWRGAYIYLASLWAPALLLFLILSGCTPWNWPAERDGRVSSLAPASCEVMLGDTERTAPPANASTSKAQGKAATGRTACRRLLSEAEQGQLDRVEATVSYLQLGGTTPPALSLPDDSPMRSWVNGNICRLGGAEGGDRGELAWHVYQGIGECGDWTRRAAQFPLSIWFGWWPGMLLTPLILLALFFFLARHSLRLRSTRRAYHRLFGSEHKAD